MNYKSASQDVVNKILEKSNATPNAPQDVNSEELKRELEKQSKTISQLIAKSWLPDKYPEGKEIREVLIRDNSDEIKSLLKKYGVDIDIFGFGGSLEVTVSWDTFKGDIEEIPGRAGAYTLPYPPRPAEVTNEQLEEWVNDTNPDDPYPKAPYIPLTLL